MTFLVKSGDLLYDLTLLPLLIMLASGLTLPYSQQKSAKVDRISVKSDKMGRNSKIILLSGELIANSKVQLNSHVVFLSILVFIYPVTITCMLLLSILYMQYMINNVYNIQCNLCKYNQEAFPKITTNMSKLSIILLSPLFNIIPEFPPREIR